MRTYLLALLPCDKQPVTDRVSDFDFPDELVSFCASNHVLLRTTNPKHNNQLHFDFIASLLGKRLPFRLQMAVALDVAAE
jgi:hypothetical protein